MTDPLNEAQTDLPIIEDKIPTKAEFEASIKKLWKTCIFLSIGLFFISGSATAGMFLAGLDPKTTVAISTTIFQVLVLSYGMAFFVPAFMTSLRTMALGVHMSRKGLDVGEKTAKHIDQLQSKLNALVNDAQGVIKPLKKLTEDLQKLNAPKIVEWINKIQKDGTLDDVSKSLKEVTDKITKTFDELRKKAVDKEIDQI